MFEAMSTPKSEITHILKCLHTQTSRVYSFFFHLFNFHSRISCIQYNTVYGHGAMYMYTNRARNMYDMTLGCSTFLYELLIQSISLGVTRIRRKIDCRKVLC